MTASLAGVTSPHTHFCRIQNGAESKSSREIYWGVEVGGFRDWRWEDRMDGPAAPLLATTPFLPSACDETVTPPFTRL